MGRCLDTDIDLNMHTDVKAIVKGLMCISFQSFFQ